MCRLACVFRWGLAKMSSCVHDDAGVISHGSEIRYWLRANSPSISDTVVLYVQYMVHTVVREDCMPHKLLYSMIPRVDSTVHTDCHATVAVT